MEVFNKPNSNDSCERRDTPSVTPQVFTLMNSDEATSRSIEMALWVASSSTSAKNRITTAYHRAHGKTPSAKETDLLLAHYQKKTNVGWTKPVLVNGILDSLSLKVVRLRLGAAKEVVDHGHRDSGQDAQNGYDHH